MIERAEEHDGGQAGSSASTRLRSEKSKSVSFTGLVAESDLSLMKSTSPIQPKIPGSDELGENMPALALVTSQRFPHRTGVDEQDNQAVHIATLDLPDIPSGISTRGYAIIKKQGEEQLRRLMEYEDKGSLPTVTSVWSCWETPKENIEEKPVKETGEEMKLAPAADLLRVQCSWTEQFKSGECFLYDESCNILKKMIKANTQLMIFKKDTVVPSIFGDGWGGSHCDVRFLESLAGSNSDFQQLLLPSEIIHDDEAKRAEAPAKIVSLAESNLRNLRRPDISLTRASMNIPNVWNLKITTDSIERLRAEKLTALPPKLTPKSPTAQRNKILPKKTEELDLRLNSFPDRPESSVDVETRGDRQDIGISLDKPQTATTKLKVVSEDKPLTTDYFLSDKFLKCNWSEPPKRESELDIREGKSLKDAHLLQQFARPAMWDLMRKKLLKVDGLSFAHAFDGVSLEALKAIIYQQLPKVKQMSLNPSAFSSVEIVEVCASLRQAVWLHTLRILSINYMGGARGDTMTAISTRILPSSKYKRVLGSSNWKDLRTFIQAIGGGAVSSSESIEFRESSAVDENTVLEPPTKRQRILPATKEVIPVRAICSIAFLEKDELLDELCTEQQIFFIERDLPPPIDILVDERNSICVVDETTFQEEEIMRRFVFSLAHLQMQQQKCWIIVALNNPIAVETEELLNLFLAALVQFRIEIQVLTSFSYEETGHFLRAIVDECAEAALNNHRILPRLWFERPFLLEEESQLERFLVSTKIVNHYAAQSLLQKICVDDLFSKSLGKLKPLVQNAVTDEQLELLLRLVQQNHGLNQRNYNGYSRS